MPDYRIQIIVEGVDNASGSLSGVAGALGRIGEFAAGNLLAGGIEKIAGAIADTGKEALESYSFYERLGTSLENLVAREIKNEAAQGPILGYQQQRVELTAEEAKKLQDLKLQKQLLAAQLQEETQRHIDMVKVWGEEALCSKRDAAELEVLRGKYNDVSAQVDALTAKSNQYQTVAVRGEGQTLSMAEALGQAAPRAQELLDWMQQLAIQSPFQTSGIAQAFRTAMAFGFTTDQAKGLTQNLVDFAAATGATDDVLMRIANSLGQVRSNGKMTAIEMRELSFAGLPVREILAKSFGVTTAEIEKMSAAGQLTADKVLPALTKAMEQDFGGAAKRQQGTFAGLLSSLADIKEIGLKEFFTGTFKAIQPYLNDFVDMLSSPATFERLRQWGMLFGQMLSDNLPRFLTFARGAFDFFQTLAQGAREALPSVQRFADAIKAAWEGLTGGKISNPFDALKGAGDLIPPELKAQIEGAKNAFKPLTDAVDGLWSTLKEKWPEIKMHLQEIGDYIRQTFTDLAPNLGSSLGTATGSITMAIQTWDDLFKNHTGSIMDAISTCFRFIIATVAGAMALALGLVAAALALLYGLWKVAVDLLNGDWEQAWKDIQSTLEKTLGTLGQSLQTFVKIAVSTVGKDLEDAKREWQSIFDNLGTTLNLVWTRISTEASRVWNDISQSVSTAVQGAEKAVDDFAVGVGQKWNEVKTALNDTWSGLTQAVNDALTGAGNALEGFKNDALARWNEVKSGLENAWSGVTGTVTQVMNSLTTAVTNFVNGAQTQWGQLKTNLTEVWTGLRTEVTGIFTSLQLQINVLLSNVALFVTALLASWQSGFENLKTTLTTMWADVQTQVNAALSGIYLAVTGILNGALAAVKQVLPDWVKAGADLVLSLAKGVAEKAGQLITAVVNAIKDALKAAGDELGKWNPLKDFQLPSLPNPFGGGGNEGTGKKMASGGYGVLDRNTLFWGEPGEAFWFSGRNRQVPAPVQVSLYVGSITTDQDIDFWAEQVARRIYEKQL